jgi:hypothetical protein
MKLIVDGADGLVTVDEAENLKSLSVELRGCSPERAAVLLGDCGLGRIEGRHAWLRIGALRAIARPPRSCSWDERFQRAMAYAQQNGWTDPACDVVRAHIEPSPHAAGTPTADTPTVDTPTADTPTADSYTAGQVAAGPPTNSRPPSKQES